MIAGSLEIELMANIARLQRDMDQANAVVSSATEKIVKEVMAVRGAVESMMNPIKAITAAFGPLLAAIGGLAMTDKIRGVITGMAELDAMAKKTGASVEGLSALKGIAKGVGGSLDDVGVSLAKMSKLLFEAQNGGKTASEAFALLKLDPANFTSSESALLGIAKAIANTEEGYQRSTAVQKIFGESGQSMVPILLEVAKAGELNGKVTTEQAENATKFEKAMAKLGGRFNGIYTDIATAILPTLVKVTEGFGAFARIGVAYIGAFTVAPAIFTAVATALGSLQMMVALAKLEMAQGATIASLFSGSLGGIVLPAEAAAGAMGMLKIATGVLFAAFAGWEIGKWLRENFVEAQLAGIAFVEGTLVAWEAVKFGASVAWAAIAETWSGAIAGMGTVLSGFLGKVSGGMQAMGMTDAAAQVAQWSASVAASTQSTSTLAARTAALRTEYEAAKTSIRTITGDMASEAIAHFSVAKATEKHGESLVNTEGKTKKSSDSADKQVKAYQDLIATIQEKIDINTKEAALGRVLNEDEKQILEIKKMVAKGTITAADASSELTKRMLAEQTASQQVKDNAILLVAAYAELRKQEHERITAYEKTVGAMDEETKKMREEIDLIGLNANQQENILRIRREVTIATKEATLAEMERRSAITGTMTREEIALAAEIAQLKERNALAGTKASRTTSAKAAEDALTEWKHISEQIEQSLTDVLMRGFGRGGSFAQGLADEAQHAFESMVLRPTFAAASRPVAGAISSAIGSFGSQATGQAGSGILGSVASSAIGTAITSGFAEVAAGYSGATIAASMVGPSATAATGLSGLGTSLAAVPGWGWALAGAAALMASGVGGSIGEVHSGGIYSTSSPSDMTTAMRVTQNDSAAARDLVNRANDAINKPLEKVGKGLVKTFDDLAKMLGTASDQFDLTLGFAADLSGKSKDKNAFGYFDLVDKATGDTLASYKNRALGTDTTAAMTKLTNDASRAMLDALAKANIPAWAEHALGKLADLDGLDALAQFAAWPKTLLIQFGADRDSLVQKFAEGLATTDAATAGQNVALSLVSSIEQTVMTAGASQIFDTVNVGIITPMLDALATGASVSEALSQSSIDAVVQKATAQAQALNELFTNVDFKAALDQIKTTVGGALGSAGAAMNYQPTYWKPDTNKAKEEQSAAEKAAEDLAKRIKDALDGLKTDGLSLQIELLRAQGNDAAAAVIELNKATEGWDAVNRELYRQRLADNTAVKEQIRAQNGLNSLHDAGVELEIKALRTIGREEAAVALERDIAIKGMSRLEVVQYDANKGLEKQIASLESLANLRSEGASLSINVLAAIGQNERALSMQREIAIRGMTALEVAQYDANRSIEKLIDGIGKFKTAFDSAKSSLSLGGVPTASGISTAGLTQSAALEANAKNLKSYLSARDADYAALIKEIAKPVVGDVSIASYLSMPTDTKGLQSLSAPAIGAMMDKVGALATNLAETDPAAFAQWGKFLENVASGLGLLNGYNQEYSKTTQTLTETEISLGEARTEEAKKLSTFTAELASAKSQADIALLKAQGKAEQAAALERENYIASLVDLTAEQLAAKVGAYDYTKAIEQQVAVMQQRQGLEQSIAQALGQTTFMRERELAALDASNRPLQQRLYALSDAATAMDAALTGVQRATDAEKTQVSKSAAAQIEALRTGIDAGAKSISDAQAQVGTLSGLFDNIAESVKSLRGNVNQELDLLQARSYIDMSLSLARAGTLPDATKLRDAISAVGKDTADAYRTMADFEFAQLVQAGKLEELGGLVGAQKTVQEKQLDSLNTAAKLAQNQIAAIEAARDAQIAALDAQLKTAQDQVNVMKGVDISVQSVAMALIGLSAAMQAQAIAKAQAQASIGTVVIQNTDGTNSQYTPDPVRYTPPSASFTLPGFAAGGMHAGGLRLVGERGMEIEATGPARYWNAADTQQFLGGGGGNNARLEQLFEQLLARIEALEQQGEDAQKTRDAILDLWDKVTEGGNAMRNDLVAISEEKLKKWLTTSTQ